MEKRIAIDPPAKGQNRLGFFERYLSLWVALCMAGGLALGKLLPSAIQGLRGLEFVKGSQINVPIAVLIWLIITPMMMKVDFGSIRNVGRKPAGLFMKDALRYQTVYRISRLANRICGPSKRCSSNRFDHTLYCSASHGCIVRLGFLTQLRSSVSRLTASL